MAETQPLYHEGFTGRLIRVPGLNGAVLLIGRGRSGLRGGLIHQGRVELHYAFPLLYYADFVFPQRVVDEFRREYHGRAALDFMLNKGNSYPRADVVGIRLSDGQRLELFMKEVDLGAGLRAFAYKAALAGSPLARLEAAVWLYNSLNRGDAIVEPGGCGDRFLGFAVRCWRCNPESLPVVYEHLGAARGA